MTSFIFETIIVFSDAIRNVNAQLVLMNRGLIYTYKNANLNATVGPADLFVPLRNKSSSLLYPLYVYNYLKRQKMPKRVKIFTSEWH